MITTLHARPQMNTSHRSISSGQIVLCPRCSSPMGAARSPHQINQLINAHRCLASEREKLQPSAAVPFS